MAEAVGMRNYKILIYPQENGGWVAEIPAISGCYALMDTRDEALKELESVFILIRDEYAMDGKALPEDKTELVSHA